MKPLLKATFCIKAMMICMICLAQNNDIPRQEAKLILQYSKLLRSVNGDWDSLSAYSDTFTRQFGALLNSNSFSFDYPFTRLIDSNFIQLKTSIDKKLRIYSWDTWKGGTMHEFNKVFQWKYNDNVYTTTEFAGEEGPGNFISQLYTVAVNNKPVYFAVTNAVFSTSEASQSVCAYTIENGNLTDTIKIFQTKTNALNKIFVNFDFFSVVGRPERPLKLIQYNDKLQTFYIPVVNDKGRLTKKNITYTLKNGAFIFSGIQSSYK